MAKRSRITAKPGQRRPLQRTTRTAGDERQLGKVTVAEEARAAELEAAILAEERAAEEARKVRERGRRIGAAPAPTGSISYTSTPLSVRAAEEYAYVKRDMRRIIVVGAFLVGILIVLQILVNGMGLFTI